VRRTMTDDCAIELEVAVPGHTRRGVAVDRHEARDHGLLFPTTVEERIGNHPSGLR
jgi:hypothetical protein